MIFRTLLVRFAPVIAGVGVVYTGAYLIKDYSVPRYEGKESLIGTTVVITGATDGIGKSVAKEMAYKGARVILGCKNQDYCIGVRRRIVDSTKNGEVFCSLLDTSSMKSIKEFVQRLEEKNIDVKILINNAAVKANPLKQTHEGFESHLGTNYLGHFFLTHLMLSNLQKNGPSRIVNVSCTDHKKGEIDFDNLNSKKGYDPTKAYNQSKLALVLFTKELASRLKGTGIHVYSVDPGICRTSLNRNMRYRKNIVTRVLISPFLWFWERSAFHGAQVIMHCALSPDLANDEASGEYYKNNELSECSELANDKLLAKKLWLVSKKWTVDRAM